MKEICNVEIKPYSQSKQEDKLASPFGISYINQDYWGFKNRMLEYIQQTKSKEFNDFSESSIVLMLIELWAFLADTLSFKIDQIANEPFIDTVTEPYNAFRLCKLVGFHPTPPIPAKAMFVGTINNVLSEDLIIQTPAPVAYEIPGIGRRTIELFKADANNNPAFGEDIVIPVGNTSTTSIVGVEGLSRKITYESNGMPYQTVQLNGDMILHNSVYAIVDGKIWESVDCFSNDDPNLEFLVEFNENYNATLIFGDGVGGKIPPKGTMITIGYRQGGGDVGNIVSGAIATTLRIPSKTQHYIVVDIRNYTRGEGGYNGDNIEDIRRKLPIHLKTQNRAVTAQDYKNLAELYSSNYSGSVGKATAVLRNHGCSGNIIDLYFLANLGNGALVKPSDDLIHRLSAEIDGKKMLTDFVCVRSGDLLLVDITIDILISSIYRKSEYTIVDKVKQRIRNLFSLTNWDFGKSLKESDLHRALTDIKEIDDINLTFTTTDGLESGNGHQNVVSTKFNQIIQLDTLVIHTNYK